MNKIEKSEWMEGPFVLIITNAGADRELVQVVSPKGGFKTQDDALFAAVEYKRDCRHLSFKVAALRTLEQFSRYLVF